jgi:hypothetical protein
MSTPKPAQEWAGRAAARWLAGWLSRCLALALLAPVAGCSSGADEPAAPEVAPRSVLFVGNSFTAAHGGLDQHLQALAASMRAPRALSVTRSTLDGATLQTLRQDAATLQAVRAGGHDRVVLQDDIPEYGGPAVDAFLEQVRWFNQEIRARGSQPVLLMAWPYERLPWATLDTIATAHRRIGAELDIPVAPVGAAMAASRAARPALDMLGPDREHETLHGSYLAACVVYATLFHESPLGATYAPAGITGEEAAFLQRLAWDSVAAWNAAATAR